MAGWFSRVSLGRRAEAEPVEFTLTCFCGGIVTGSRGSRMQVVVCPACAAQLCVLPISPYPRPKLRTPKKKKNVKPTRTPSPLPDDDDEDDVHMPPPIPVRGRKGSPKETREPASTKKAARGAVADRPADPAPLRTAPRIKIFTPLRLIAVGMIAVVTLAGWWVAHQRAVSNAVRIFAEASKLGRAALSKSDYEVADLQLSRAAEAVDLLGRDDREARQVRQLAREARAAQGLDLTSLFEILSEARIARGVSDSDWQQTVRNTHQGRWYLLESNGLQFTGGDPPQWTFTLPLIPGVEQVRIRGDFSRWARDWGSTPPTHIIFAGQLEDVRTFQDATSKGWEIVLKKDSLFLWADAALYEDLGGTLDESTLATLKSQGQLLGIGE